MSTITKMDMSKAKGVTSPDKRATQKPIHMPGQPKGNKKNVSGSGMDRKLERNSVLNKKWLGGAALLVLLTTSGWYMLNQMETRSLTVYENRVGIGTVTQGVFEDVIPVRGRIEPAQTVFLDAVEGGRVEQVLVEAGTQVKAGDLLVELSNPSLQLEVLGNEARVAEQLNSMRTLELNLEQNRLTHKRNLNDIEYQIRMLNRQVEREKKLVAQNALADSNLLDTQDTLTWYQQQQALTLESQQSDARMQEAQLAFLKETSTRLESNLAISRQNLENMNVRAPVDGVLSGFDIQIGQNISQGERFGQIDTPDDFKLTARIDEFYLDRVSIGQTASYNDYQLVVRKIYPQVQDGQFRVDFGFIGEQPEGIRRGQSLQTRLSLGDASEAILIPTGSFYQDTGGNWIFVLTPDGSEAIRRQIRLGRRNSDFIEVLDGLAPNERVVLSSYSGYKDMERLTLN